jgi:hypothetical protein
MRAEHGDLARICWLFFGFLRGKLGKLFSIFGLFPLGTTSFESKERTFVGQHD